MEYLGWTINPAKTENSKNSKVYAINKKNGEILVAESIDAAMRSIIAREKEKE